MRSKIATGVLGSLLAISAAAQPALAADPASALSLAPTRAATTSEGASDQMASPGIGVILGVVGIIAGAVIVVADSDDEPDSP
ncbi:hypothetical protein [Sphingosinithalassobacter sp. CS137]|uniref:hypothetical protein n=1 Tax=Sphingosinithalassobacter sp. CS137 TaxID=2762748 RepID=UPI00165E5235|nr:hypothetical protein [Sphingosinithalassobacter sp. CS137]